jgi:tryptophan synthase alpha chain
MPLGRNRLTKTFVDLRAEGRKTLLPFLTAGYPDLETTEALLHELARRGVRVCELGFPFSDPIADGPVIQASYTEALAAGITSDKIFAMMKRFRAAEKKSTAANSAAVAPRGSATPGGSVATSSSAASGRRGSLASSSNPKSEIRNPQLAVSAMVSYSIVFRHGVAKFLSDAARAGFDATIIPDLPLEEAAGFEKLAAAAGLANVMLISPTTPGERRLEIARHSRGFIYFISIAGITGERTRLPQSTIDAVAELRTHTATPVCVGFGISGPQTVTQVCSVADGAIVGSAIVRRITDLAAAKTPRAKLVQQVGEFVAELLAPLE